MTAYFEITLLLFEEVISWRLNFTDGVKLQDYKYKIFLRK